jgi:hypothetical protein
MLEPRHEVRAARTARAGLAAASRRFRRSTAAGRPSLSDQDETGNAPRVGIYDLR